MRWLKNIFLSAPLLGVDDFQWIFPELWNCIFMYKQLTRINHFKWWEVHFSVCFVLIEDQGAHFESFVCFEACLFELMDYKHGGPAGHFFLIFIGLLSQTLLSILRESKLGQACFGTYYYFTPFCLLFFRRRISQSVFSFGSKVQIEPRKNRNSSPKIEALQTKIQKCARIRFLLNDNKGFKSKISSGCYVSTTKDTKDPKKIRNFFDIGSLGFGSDFKLGPQMRTLLTPSLYESSHWFYIICSHNHKKVYLHVTSLHIQRSAD